MKINKVEVLFNTLSQGTTDVVMAEIKEAVARVKWPVGAATFGLAPVRKGNGVKPIKNACMDYLQSQGWLLEHRIQINASINPGPIDATKKVGASYFAFEWETGNISSSHRAVNKMVLGMMDRTLLGGVLVLPSRSMYEYLTDRVGNFKELEPYFDVWRRFNIKEGFLAVVEVEHDVLSDSIPLIPKGTDGRALR